MSHVTYLYAKHASCAKRSNSFVNDGVSRPRCRFPRNSVFVFPHADTKGNYATRVIQLRVSWRLHNCIDRIVSREIRRCNSILPARTRQQDESSGFERVERQSRRHARQTVAFLKYVCYSC